MTLLLGLATAIPANAYGGYGYINGLNSMCMTIYSAAWFTPAEIDGCSNRAGQLWKYNSSTHTIDTLVGGCLDVYLAGTSDLSPVVLYQCNASDPAEIWIQEPGGALYNPNSYKCLDDPAFGGPGTQLVIYYCNGGANQNWLVNSYG